MHATEWPSILKPDAGSDPHGLGRRCLPGHGRGCVDRRCSRSPQSAGCSLIAPEDWTRKPPRSGFLLAEFSLPRAEGDAERRPADHYRPWAGAWTRISPGGGDNLEERSTNESIEKTEVAGVPITLVDLSGTYSGQHGGVGSGGRTTELSDVGGDHRVADPPACGQMHRASKHGRQARGRLRGVHPIPRFT